MTPEQLAALGYIREMAVYGDGTTFRYHGEDISDDVLWALQQGYALYLPLEAVSLTKAGHDALKAAS
jgi:hypothetical protein